MALVGAPSRFSVLKVDVSDPRERNKPQNNAITGKGNVTNNAKNKQAPAAAKGNKKKNTNNNTNKKKQNQPQGAAGGGGSNPVDKEKFDQWKKRDEELVEDMFEKELQEALLRSRLEQNTQQQQRQQQQQQHSSNIAPTSVDPGAAGRKGKVKLSLAEFHEKFQEEPTVVSQSPKEPLSKVLAQMKQQEKDEEHLRRQSARDASAILTRERVAEEIRERAQQPRVVPQEEFDRMLEMKKKQIEHMAKVLNQTNKEMAILQEQNKDLEGIVSKGEMKKKVDLIREVEELRQVKDELTEQIAELHVALEQEKSKVHQLTLELQKKR